MYGLIVESIIESIKHKYGTEVWKEVKKISKIDKEFFSTHEEYSEAVVQKILRSLSIVTGKCT